MAGSETKCCPAYGLHLDLFEQRAVPFFVWTTSEQAVHTSLTLQLPISKHKSWLHELSCSVASVHVSCAQLAEMQIIEFSRITVATWEKWCFSHAGLHCGIAQSMCSLHEANPVAVYNSAEDCSLTSDAVSLLVASRSETTFSDSSMVHCCSWASIWSPESV